MVGRCVIRHVAFPRIGHRLRTNEPAHLPPVRLGASGSLQKENARALFKRRALLRNNPGSDLLSHAVGPRSTIGGRGLNFRVRNGNGCDPSPMTTGKRACGAAERVAGGVLVPGVRERVRARYRRGPPIGRPRLCQRARLRALRRFGEAGSQPVSPKPEGRRRIEYPANGSFLVSLNTCLAVAPEARRRTQLACNSSPVGEKRELWSSLTAD